MTNLLFSREVVWVLVVGLSGLIVLAPSWPVTVALCAALAAAVVVDREKQATRRKEVLGEEVLVATEALRGRVEAFAEESIKLGNRLAVVENRTRPVNGGR